MLQWQSSAFIFCHHGAGGLNHAKIPDKKSTSRSFIQLDLAIGDHRAIAMIMTNTYLHKENVNILFKRKYLRKATPPHRGLLKTDAGDPCHHY